MDACCQNRTPYLTVIRLSPWLYLASSPFPQRCSGTDYIDITRHIPSHSSITAASWRRRVRP